MEYDGEIDRASRTDAIAISPSLNEQTASAGIAMVAMVAPN